MKFKLLIGVFLFSELSLVSYSKALAVTPVIKIDGSSTVFPITEAMAEEFQIAKKGQVRVTVGISGTGGGFKKFCRSETDIQNASRPIQTKEMADCKAAGVKFFELPIAYDATVVVVNPKNDWMNEVTIAELKRIWEPEAQGKLTEWSQLNPKWPKEKLKLYGAGSDSGTFDYFTEAVVGKAKASRGDYSASENDNTLVSGIASDKFSLGYLPLAYYEENKAKLKVLPVFNAKEKAAILPSRQTVEKSTYSPLSRPVFIYINETAFKKPEVKEFVEFYLSQAEKIVPQVKYVPLPSKLYELAKSNLKKNKMGTVFKGHSEVGMKVEELMKKESQLE